MFSISYSPITFLVDLSFISNCFQNSSETSSLFAIFDFFIHSKIISLALLSATQQSTLQRKFKNKDVLSVSVKFDIKNTFGSGIDCKFFKLFHLGNKKRQSYRKQTILAIDFMLLHSFLSNSIIVLIFLFLTASSISKSASFIFLFSDF